MSVVLDLGTFGGNKLIFAEGAGSSVTVLNGIE